MPHLCPAQPRARKCPGATPPTGAPPLPAHSQPAPRTTGPPREGSTRRLSARPTMENQGRKPIDGAAPAPDIKDKDTIGLCFIRGDAEPTPNPDKCTVIYKITPLGETVLHRAVPRSRWLLDQECIEDF